MSGHLIPNLVNFHLIVERKEHVDSRTDDLLYFSFAYMRNKEFLKKDPTKNFKNDPTKEKMESLLSNKRVPKTGPQGAKGENM